MANVLGIDFGYRQDEATCATASFAVTRDAARGVRVIGVSAPAETISNPKLTQRVESGAFRNHDTICLNVPITPKRLKIKPDQGRFVDRRFSRGNFANSNRGPQPSSIASPTQGWRLYVWAVAFMNELKAAGFPPLLMPPERVETPVSMAGHTMEVIPKLSLSLMVGKELVRSRPKHAYYGQITNWLFSHLFSDADRVERKIHESVNMGAARGDLIAALGPDVVLDESVWNEAIRIENSTSNAQRQELVGGFTAGFQGALAFAGAASLYGCAGEYQGHYLLPRHWHADWRESWHETEKKTDDVIDVDVAAWD
jgi:hypothetical protein